MVLVWKVFFNNSFPSSYYIAEESANYIFPVQKELFLIKSSVDLLWWII